jgi:ubiquinone/menaquinone biosynthesis C-methylase UbiE
MNKAEYQQHKYYTEKASLYNDKHVIDNDEHYVALKHIMSLLGIYEITSILDVGSGTGRAVKYFSENGIAIHGIEPVNAMIKQAIHNNNIKPGLLTCATGNLLPFKDNSFNAVCALGVMHHVQTPDVVVREMMRVAKKAVFLSDSNRFGQGSMFARLTKLLLYKARLWGVVNFIKTGGKGYRLSEGDGLSYSYSIFDSYDLLASWADRIILIPTSNGESTNWSHPLLTSSHILICAIKEK